AREVAVTDEPGEHGPAPEAAPAGVEADSVGEPAAAPPSRRVNPFVELIVILLAAFALWYVIDGWVVKPYRIPSASMEPTLQEGDRVLVARFVYHLHDPRRGDVVVFHPPGTGGTVERGASSEASVYFIKRVIGLPGE